MRYFKHEDFFLCLNDANEGAFFHLGDQEIQYAEDFVLGEIEEISRREFHNTVARFLSKIKNYYNRSIERDMFANFDRTFIPYKILGDYEMV